MMRLAVRLYERARRRSVVRPTDQPQAMSPIIGREPAPLSSGLNAAMLVAMARTARAAREVIPGHSM